MPRWPILPGDLPSRPRFRKANPAAATGIRAGVDSKTISAGALYDVADTIIAQRISQVNGVGEVTVSGADQPAVRIALNPVALSNAGVRPMTCGPRSSTPIRSARSASSMAAVRARRSRSIARCAPRPEFRGHHHQELERQFRPSVRRCRGRGFRTQRPLDRLVQQAAGGTDPDHQAGATPMSSIPSTG